MKKIFFLLMTSVLIYSVNAQNSPKTNLVGNTDLLWTEDVRNESTVIPKNPEAALPQEINSSATCFCVVSFNDLTGHQSRSGVCMDLTGIVNTTYGGLTPMKDDNRKDCVRRCTDAAGQLTAAQKQAIADCACAEGVANDTKIRAFGAVGTKEYQSAAPVGTLINSPQVTSTTCKCPSGWLSNTTNVDGGVTADGKCKKMVCGPIGIKPPADGTQVGTWGFTWGNTLWAYGSSANGGAAACKTVIVSPKVCKFQ